MSVFRKKPETVKTIKKKISQEEKVLNTHIQLEQLRDSYSDLLVMQRRILREPDATKHEKDRAKEKIRAGLCSYTIVNEALRHLDEITSDVELTNSLKTLSRSLRAVNKLGRKASPGPITKFSLNHGVAKIEKRENQVQAEKVFSEKTLGTVDEWLSSRWENVAERYISGEDLTACVRSSRSLIEEEPELRFDDYDVFDTAQPDETAGTPEELDVSDELKELLNANLF
jgi:hypothetical protein